ncbi:MAG: T9SS type A sorting domain-containing protein [Bacteroidota bacterium]
MRVLLFVLLALTALPVWAQLPYGPAENMRDRFFTDNVAYEYGEPIMVYLQRYNAGASPLAYLSSDCPPLFIADGFPVMSACPTLDYLHEFAPGDGYELSYTLYPDSLGFPALEGNVHELVLFGHSFVDAFAPATVSVNAPQYLGGQLLVNVRQDADPAEVETVMRALNAVDRDGPYGPTWMIEGMTPEQAVEAYGDRPIFESFEPFRPHPTLTSEASLVIADEDVIVSARTNQAAYLPDDTVHVSIALTNHSDETVILDYGTGIEAFFTVDPGARCTPCVGIAESHTTAVGSGGRINFESSDNGHNNPECFRFVPAQCGLEPGSYTLNAYAIHYYAPAVVPFTVLPPVSNEPETIPATSALTAAPNPFVDRTTLSLALADAQRIEAVAYDVLGRRVAMLHDGPLGAGTHTLPFEAARLPAGVYVVRVTGDDLALTRRVTLAR